MEEYCATNTEIKVRLFLSRLNNLEVTVFFNLVRNPIGRVPSFKPEEFPDSYRDGPTRMNSSMEEQWLVKPTVESSNLSSSAKKAE